MCVGGGGGGGGAMARLLSTWCRKVKYKIMRNSKMHMSILNSYNVLFLSSIITKLSDLIFYHQIDLHPVFYDLDVIAWWRHHMATLSLLLTLCEGNPPVTGGFPSERASSTKLWFFYMYAWTNGWTNSGINCDFKCYDGHVISCCDNWWNIRYAYILCVYIAPLW